MKLFRVILLYFLFVPFGAISHDDPKRTEIGDEFSFRTKSYGKKEGYSIKSQHSSIVDKFGTLWVGGTTENLVLNQLNEGGVGLFYFNGTRFQEYPLPDDLKQAIKIKLLAGTNNEFFVLFKFQKHIKVFSIDPISLTYTELIQPMKRTDDIVSVKMVELRKGKFIIYNYNDKSLIYEITENHKFKLFIDYQFNKKGSTFFEKVIELKSSVVLNDIHSGIYLLKDSDKSIKKLSPIDLGVKLKKDKKIKIVSYFNLRDTVFFKFNVDDSYFYLNPLDYKWYKTNAKRFPFTENIDYNLFSDKSDYIQVLFQKNEEINRLNFYLKEDNKLTASIPLPNFNHYTYLNSRDYNKEVFVLCKNQLIQISFHKKKIKTFLNKFSIRSISQLSENKILVGTEQNGLMEIDLFTGEEKEYIKNTFNCDMKLNTGIYADKDGIYVNFMSGLSYIDRKTKETSCYSLYPITTLKNKGDNIYYGTNGFKLMRFDKKLRKHIPLAETKGIFVEELEFVGDTIYCATHSGLLMYYNGKTEIIDNPLGKYSYLCIIKHPTLGLLLGSIEGKVFQFDPKTKKFRTLYNDLFNSSIATLVLDDNNDIWINSFKGFIHYKIKDKSTIRYGVHDGFSHNEANRHSSLKLKNGNLLIGTLRGLNYFNPNTLTLNKIESSLKFTAIKYLRDDQKERIIISPKDLNNIDRISLTPSNRNIHLFFGFDDLLGLNEDLKYKYRLNNGPWRIGNDFGELFLGNLAPDDYNLEIIAINQLETEIGSPIKLTIIAKQFLYKTSWFLLLASILISIIIFGITFQYIKNQKLKQYFSDKIINAHLVEQVLLSEKLHDSVGQKLLLTKNNLILHKKIPKEELTHLDEVISEIRNISHDLHPIQFKELGLKKSVINLVEDFQRNSSIYYSHNIDCLNFMLTLEKGIILFGIIQECLNNVEKHSEADACRVNIYIEGKRLKLQIKDNGKGFQLNKTIRKFSLGLKTIKEKAGYLDANLTIESKLNEGTTVELSIKINTK